MVLLKMLQWIFQQLYSRALKMKIKIPFFLESLLLKAVKPQLVTVVEFFLDGKPVKKFYGKSVNSNFLTWIYAQFANNEAAFATSPAGNNAKTDIRMDDGSWQNRSSSVMLMGSPAVGIDFRGIVFSSVAQSLLPNVYTITNIIRHGVGANQLSYSVQGSVKGSTILGQNTEFILQRTAQNLSGADISVAAFGIYCGGSTFLARDYFLIYVDNAAITVVNGQTLTCQVTWKVTT